MGKNEEQNLGPPVREWPFSELLKGTNEKKIRKSPPFNTAIKAKIGSSYTLSLTSTLDEGEWSNAKPRPFYPRERDPVPIAQEAGCNPGPLGTGEENLTPTVIRSPDRTARSDSL